MITGFVLVMIKFRLHPHSLPILLVFFFGRKQEAKYSAMKSICRRFLIYRTFRCMSDFMPELFFNDKQLFVLSEGTVQQSKARKVSSFDGGRQIIFTSPTIVMLEHALAKLRKCFNFRFFSIFCPSPRANYNESTRSTWSEQGKFVNILVSTIYHFINRVWIHLCEGSDTRSVMAWTVL